MNNPDHIFENFETMFWVKILTFFDADPRSGMNIPDPQHCLCPLIKGMFLNLQVIEPQFQRDFISLLPKELALYVLAFLHPKDLLR
jgi:hypothetical protein